MADVAEELAELEARMAEDIDGYFKDAAAQSRYGDLLAAKEAGSAAPAGPSRNEERIREIEAEMAKPQNVSRYWRDGDMRQEYRSLLEGRAPAPIDDGPDMAEALGLDGEVAQEVVERVTTAFRGLDVRAMNESFDALSEPAKLGFYRLLADPSSVLRDESSVDAFADELGQETFAELCYFEANMAPAERAALRRACLLT